jgi:hypothetical protein
MATAVLFAVLCGAWFMAAVDWMPAASDADDGVSPWFGRNEVAIPAATRPVPAPDARAFTNRSSCDRCGVIESVRAVNKSRNPPGVAALSGGKGGEVMAVLHVVLNAMVGNPTGPSRLAPSYEITVRFHDGSQRTITETGAPAWKPGDPVKVINGRIKPDV